MRILVTNFSLTEGTGTETAVLDLALALRRRGHTVICYAPHLGRSAARVRATGTPVVDTIDAIGEAPDIIHGHHSGPTMVALARFPGVPAIFVCHDWSSVHDDPPLHPRIRRYFYVRHVLRERLVAERGISPRQVGFLPNVVDLARLPPPRTPPRRLRTAGVYSHAGAIPYLDTLAKACEACGIGFLGELVVDNAARARPEQTLPGCDLVFASGRMAIEALVVGCTVINADRFGIGGLVTTDRFDAFVAANFAVGALSQPASVRLVAETLGAYDADDATLVLARARQDCDVRAIAGQLEETYQQVLAEIANQAADEDRAAGQDRDAAAFAAYLQTHLQTDRLFNGEFARRKLVPESDDALTQTIERLGKDVRDLRQELRYLTRTRLGRALSEGWRAARGLLRA
jgi:hypothetical protein